METFSKRASYKALQTHFNDVKTLHMRELFANDTKRFEQFSTRACGIELDYSKNRVTHETMGLLFDLARESKIEQHRDAMFAGEKINSSEERAVLHTALRNMSGNPVFLDSEDIMPSVKATLAKMKKFVNEVHDGTRTGFTNKRFTDVLAIGIGGSFLGPKVMTEALTAYKRDDIRVHFVANIDGVAIHDVLEQLCVETTLVIMSSKSFGTQETVKNTETAKAWFLNNGGSFSNIAQHFICASTNVKAAMEFGIDENNIFPMWDWVGGRYSIWSVIGLPVALGLGFENFEKMLEGAYAMDEHFKTAPLEQNLPVIMAVIGIWYINFFNAQSHVLLPYDHYLRNFPSYIQQLDMESNGKSATSTGIALDYATGPIIWGGEGTNGQHAFHQLIHQSSTLIPADFLLPLVSQHEISNHHAMLASNCFGQTQALMQGKTLTEVVLELSTQGHTTKEIEQMAPQRVFEGNKPSNTLLFEKITPTSLGSLVALYEHKVFIQGAIWDINSFDQWGVELGKALGVDILSKLEDPTQVLDDDSSTNAMIKRFRERLQTS